MAGVSVSALNFRARLQLARGATHLVIPCDVVHALGGGALIPVVLTVNGHPVTTTLHRVQGTHVTALNRHFRARAGVAAGQEVEVTVRPDDGAARRTVEIPADLVNALDNDPEARRVFHALPSLQQRRYVDWIKLARRTDTRERRVHEAIARLRH